MALENAFGALALDATLEAVRALLDTPSVTVVTGSQSSSGDTTIIAAPGAGQKLRLHMIHATPDSDNSAFPRIIFKGSGGGELFRGAAIQHSRYSLDLPANEALVLNLDTAATIHWTCHYTIESV